ncbi:hypothetical protein [Acinetobacter junii]|uniref:hypothetical protein n=1 Tax=Acinetobacter junii TaxID=40215 RepID=UPI00124D6C61|nr:hypothetical protein [Acinetobacter junii]
MIEYINAILNKPEALAQVLAASIGVFGLVVTFLVTYWKTKTFQKSEKIAEARLTIYLDLAEKYTAYAAFLWLSLNELDSQSTKDQKMDYFINFLTSCNKAYMVCNSTSKDELDKGFNYIFKINRELEAYGLDVADRSRLLKNLEKKAMELSLIMREEIGVLDDRTLENSIIQRNFV